MKFCRLASRRLSVPLVCALLWAGVNASAAEAPGGDAAHQPLRFRRVYVPANAVQDWPLGSARYLPIEPAEFEKLVSTAGALPAGEASAAVVRLARATYRARLEGDLLAGGTAQLAVVHTDKDPALLLLEPWRPAIGAARWLESKRAATIGIGPDGKQQLLADEAGTLEIEWSQAGQRDVAGTLSFDIQLPPSPETTLELDLPADMAPSANAGIASAGEVKQNRRMWRLELGGHHACLLRISAGDPASQRRRLALLRTATNYEFSARGIDVTCQWKIDVQHDPLKQLQLTLDPGLRLISARYGETALGWTAQPMNDAGSQAVIELPEGIRGTSRVLRLTAIAPLAMNENITLPRIQAPGLAWQEGSMALLVAAPLELERLAPILCRQSRIGTLPAPLAGESIELQSFGPEATAQIVLGRQSQPVRGQMATSIALGGSRRTAEVVADLELAAGEHFSLRADVPEHWVIHSLTAAADDTLGEWTLGPVEGHTRPLSIRLNKALSANHPLRLVMHARASNLGSHKALGPDELEIIRWRGVRIDRQLLALSAAEGYRVLLDGDELRRLSPEELDASDAHLFLRPPRDLIVRLDPRHSDWRVRVEPEAPRFEVKATVAADIDNERLVERYSIHCTPENSAVDRLLVHFTQPRAATPRWSLDDGRFGQLTATRLTSSEQSAAGVAPDGETWQVLLQKPRREAFELRAMREMPWDNQVAVSLVCVPGATSQQGTILVSAPGQVPLAITNRHLEPVEPGAASTHSLDARAAFRYDPTREMTADSPPGLSLTRAVQPAAVTGGVVWDWQLDSRAEPTGRTWHVLLLKVQRSGAASCRLELPAGAEVHGLSVDNKPTLWKDGQVEATIPLPPTRFCTITVGFVTRHDAWSSWPTLHAPLVRVDLPVLSRHWTLWLPPGYDVLSYRSGDNQLVIAERPWVERLLGPLARDPRHPRFDPLNQESWSRLAHTPAAKQQQQDSSGVQVLERLGAILLRQRNNPGPAITWGQVLGELASDGTPRTPVTIGVDSHALEVLGVRPESKVRFSPRAKELPLAAACRVMAESNLALAVDSERVIFTVGAARGPAPQDTNLPIRLRDLVVSERAAGSRPRFERVASWRTGARPAWLSGALPGVSDSPGWVPHSIDVGASGAELTLESRSAADALRLSVWLVVAVLGWWFLRRPKAIAALVAGTIVAALACPAWCAPIASGAVLGAVTCLLARLMLPDRPRAASAALPSDSVASTERVVVVACLAICFGLAAAGPNAFGQVAENPEPARGEVFSVFIPSDEQGKPTGGRYQVSEEFLTELRRRAQQARGAPHAWLLAGADYQLTLAPSVAEMGLEVAEFVARFEVQVFDAATKIRIPLEREGMASIPRTALLDGRLCDIEWDSDGHAFTLTVDEPGLYRIELELDPVVRAGGDLSGCELKVPPLAASKIEVRLPPEAGEVELPGAGGLARVLEGRDGLFGYLGPLDRLAIRWPQTRRGPGGPTFDAEELLWLKVRPGSVVLDARFKLKVLAGQFGDLSIVADPRLRLLPFAGPDWRLVEARTQSADPTGTAETRTLRFAPQAPIADEAVFHVSFLVTGTSALGNLRVPRLEVLGSREVRRYLAASVDAALEYEPQQGEPLQAITPANFAAQWGDAMATPQLAFEIGRGEPVWSLATRPRQARTTGRQSLAYHVYRGAVEVNYDAQLLTTDGYTFQHRLLAPANLELDRVSVLEDGLERATRWGRDPAGTVTVFLSAAVTGPQQLSLSGRLRAPVTGSVALPVVRLEEAKFAHAEVRLSRTAAVRVEVEQARGLSVIDSAASESHSLDGHGVARWTADDEKPSLKIHIEPNRPSVQVEQAAVLSHDDDGWQLKVDSRWNVGHGLLDVIRFEIPATWPGPFTIQPAAEHQLLKSPGTGGLHLLVRPAAPVTGSYRVSISGPVVFDEEQPVELPDVVPLGADRLSRYFQLPDQLGTQQATWELSGLKPAAWPRELADASKPAGQSYQATGRTPAARLKTMDRGLTRPRVLLADIHLSWHIDRSYEGLATFDIEPADRASCLIEVPPECRLLQCSVNGLPATPAAAGVRRWRIGLLTPRLPQQLEVLFAGRLASTAAVLNLPAPVVWELPTEKTLWSIDGPAVAGSPLLEAGQRTSAAAAELARMQAMIQSLNRPQDEASSVSRDELTAWYGKWTDAWRAQSDALSGELPDLPASRSAAMAAEAAAMERKVRDLTGELGLSSAANSFDGSKRTAVHPAELWAAATHRAGEPAVIDRSSTSVGLRFEPATEADLRARLIAAMLLTVAGVIVAWALGGGRPLNDWLRRWSHVLGVLAGFAWWLWLAPSVLGLVIVLASALSSLRCGFRRTRDPGSTVVRLSSL